MCATSIAAYRARIGLFHARCVHVRVLRVKNGYKRSLFYFGVVLSAMLIIGGVELNPGPGKTLDDIWEKLNGFEVLKDDVKSIKKDVNELTGTISRMESEMGVLREGYDKLKEENEELAARLDRLEGHSRRQNLVFYNIPEDKQETWEVSENKVRKLLSQKLNINLENMAIERAHRVGKPGNYNRPIVARFSHFKIKAEILGQTNRLKGTHYGISEDYTERVRKTRSELKGYMLHAKQENHRAMLRYDKLVVNGRYYTLEELQEKNVPKIEDERRRRRQESSSPNTAMCKKQRVLDVDGVSNDNDNGGNTNSQPELNTDQQQQQPQTSSTASAAAGGVAATPETEQQQQQHVTSRPAATLTGWLSGSPTPWQKDRGYNTRAKKTHQREQKPN